MKLPRVWYCIYGYRLIDIYGQLAIVLTSPSLMLTGHQENVEDRNNASQRNLKREHFFRLSLASPKTQ